MKTALNHKKLVYGAAAKVNDIMRYVFLPADGAKILFGRLMLLNVALIALGISLGILLKNDSHHFFGEGRALTWLSTLQLLGAAYICWQIKNYFDKNKRYGASRDGFFWAVISAGFVFLAADEVTRIHERLDHTLHLLFRFQETELSDQLDDMILLLYALIGLVFIYYYRSQAKRYLKVLPLFFGAGLLFLLMVAADAACNNLYYLRHIYADEAQALRAMSWLGVLEDSLKSIAEIFFITAFYQCFSLARSSS